MAGRGAQWLALAGSVMLAACSGGTRPDTRTADAPPATRIPYRAAIPVPPPRPLPKLAPADLTAAIDRLGRYFDGRVGIAVRSVDDGWSVESNADMRLPQQSVSKLWVAITVMDFLDQGRLKLSDPVTVTREDLTVFHQPIAALATKEGGYVTTVGGLLDRAMTMSDNTANDRLLHYVGGPAAVRDMIRRKGLGNIRFGPGERLLQAGTAGLEWKPEYAFGSAFTAARARLPASARLAAFEQYVADPPDGAAAAAIAAALAKLKRGEVLSRGSTAQLLGIMAASRTDKARLRGALPGDWVLAHKTGTGQDLLGRTAGFNDVGLLTAPDGKSYALAVMIGDTQRPVRERQQLMQSVVNAVVASHGGRGTAPLSYTAP